MTHEAASLRRILGSNCCAGCGLCAALAPGRIDMQLADDGFLRPVQHAPIDMATDRLIGEVCPGLNLDLPQPSSGHMHPLWGPVVALRSGAACDRDLRHHASSGGALSAILLHILDSGLAGRVVQIAASPDAPLENITVVSRDAAAIRQAAGSRYAPSAPLARLGDELAQPGRFALVGKPCDIAAARALARHDPRVNEKIPVMLSFFCAGVPSTRGGDAILRKLDVAKGDVAAFRYRGDGWPGEAAALLRDGSTRAMSYAASWGGILSRHVQFRCKICPDGTGGFADIVCADAWHCDERGYPLFEETDGRSLIVSRSAQGEAIVRAAIARGLLEAEPGEMAQIEAMQPSQARRKRLVLSRLAAMAMLGRALPRFHGLQLLRAALSASPAGHAKSFLGMLRRLLAKKRA